MTKALVSTQVRIQQLMSKGEAGQGTLEYVGMVIVAALIVVALIAAARTVNLAKAFTDAIKTVTG